MTGARQPGPEAAGTAKARLLLVGALPPPLTGQSIAFEMVADHFAAGAGVKILDLADRGPRRDAEFTLQRTFSIIGIAGRVWANARSAQLVYLQVAQSRWGFVRDLLVISVARLRGKPVIGHLHGGGYAQFYESQPALFQALIRSTLRGISRMIVLSTSLRSNFAFMGSDYAKRIRVVPNACPVPPGRPRKAPQGRLHLVYLSNLLVEKGFLDCIDAISHLRRLLPGVEIRLSLAGAFLLGNDEFRSVADVESTSLKQVRYTESAEEVSFVGVVDGAEKVALLDDADLFLLPTYYANEGQPISLIEGLARGLPCVVTDWRGIADIVGDQDVAAFVPPRNPLAIAEAAAALYRDPARYEACSARAVELARRFNRERHLAQLTDIFDECSTGPRAEEERQKA